MKIKLVISDFHLSRGKWLRDGRRNPLEDFHQDDRFAEFLDYYSSGEYADADVELIINGDFFDPLAVIPLPSGPRAKRPQLDYPLEVEESAAVDKIRTICEAHEVSMQGLRTFLNRGKKIIFRWGNHDAAILWPEVQTYLRGLLDPQKTERISFQIHPYHFDRVMIDHGHQYEALNHFDTDHLFIDRKTRKGELKRIQNLPFGSFFVLGFINPIKLKHQHITWVQPFHVFLRWSFYMNPLFFWINGAKAVWFFIKMRLVTHPMRWARIHKTFLLVLEIFRRPSLEREAERLLTESDATPQPFDTIIMGHNHRPQVRVFANGKTYINTGTWTPVTSLEMETLGHHVRRTYALVTYQADGKARAHLKVWQGTPHTIDDFNQT